LGALGSRCVNGVSAAAADPGGHHNRNHHDLRQESICIPAEISDESIDDLVHAMLTGEEIDMEQLIKESPELAAQFANVQGMPDVSQLTSSR